MKAHRKNGNKIYQDIFKILDHTMTQLSSGKQQNNKGKINTFI